jgi:UDP-3-O-[3-hydroxymyristoyl] glucosamine N-acyltransferase
MRSALWWSDGHDRFRTRYNPPMKLSALATTLGATLHGDPDLEITGVAGIEQARPGQVTFVSNKKYIPLARTTQASAILVEPGFAEIPAATLRLADPYLAFARTIELFYTPPAYPAGIHPTAVISPSAKLGSNIHISPYVVVGDHVVLGDDAVLLPHVVIYAGVTIGARFFAHAHAVVREHCVLGDDVVLQNGVVVGSEGFGFAKLPTGAWHKIPQSGNVVIEDGVEIQTNSCIDRASVGETRIMRGAKVDNLVQVGHGSTVGQNTLLCAQVGLAGSSEIGNNAILAGQAGVAGHCRVGNGVIITAQSATSHDIPDGQIISGSPAFDNRQWLRSTAVFNRLPEMLRDLRRLQKERQATE